MSDEARAFFDSVTSGLDAAGVKWKRAESLVRGLDYYRHTAFEFIPDEGSAAANALGSQSTILGGGRYVGLIESLGGPATPAVGWAAGIERLAMLVGEKNESWLEFVLIPVGEAAEGLCAQILPALRSKGLSTEMAYRGNLKKRMQRANSAGAEAAIIIGEEELVSGKVTVRDLKSGEQASRPIDDILDRRVGASATRAMLMAGLGGRIYEHKTTQS